MVCIECFVVPILFVLAAYFKQLVTYISSLFQSKDSSTSSTPPPFNPSMINLSAHGLPAATIDQSKLSAFVAEEKEGPASAPYGEDGDGEVVGVETVKRRK